MTLRDIFDQDPRSKQQLRVELRDHETALTALSAQRDQLLAAATIQQDLNAECLAELETGKNEIVRLSDDLKQFGRDLAVSTIIQADHASELAKVANRADGLTHERDGLKAAIETLERESNGLKKLVQNLKVMHWTPAEVEGLQKRETLVIRNFVELQSRESRLAQLVSSGVELKISSEHKALRSRVEIAEAEARSANDKWHHLEAEFEKVRKTLNAVAAVRSTNGPEEDSASHSSSQISDLQAQLDAAVIEIANLQRGTGTEVWNLKNDLKRCMDEIALKSYEISALKNAVGADNPKMEKLQRELTNCQQDLSEWKKVSTRRENEIRKLVPHLEHATQQAAELKDQIRHLTSTDLSIFSCEDVLAWMFSATTPKRLKVEHGHLHLMGHGPWDVDAFGRLMEDRGFKLWALPDAEIEHIVVGRNSWNRDDLVQHIDARQGLGLRIYSQEMWFAAMSTGRDPFDADQELLNAFADGHEALEYLREPGFDWPDLSITEPVGVTIVSHEEEFGVRESPMHMMGYRVGETGPSQQTRQAILDEFLCAKILSFGDDCSSTYRKNWGRPESAQRLYRMAVHIKHVLDGPGGKDWRRPQAREDWMSDLAWLKVTYFKRAMQKFIWPDTVVK